MNNDKLKNIREAYFKYKRNHPEKNMSITSFVAGWQAREEFEKLNINKIIKYLNKIFSKVFKG